MGKTILTVDDSATMRQMVSFTLTQAGYRVIEAENGQDALDKLHAESCSLILTDLNMPVMDGIALVQAIRSLPEYRSTPVLVLTTESEQSKKMACRSAGANGWISKPFEPSLLLNVVERVLVA